LQNLIVPILCSEDRAINLLGQAANKLPNAREKVRRKTHVYVIVR